MGGATGELKQKGNGKVLARRHMLAKAGMACHAML